MSNVRNQAGFEAIGVFVALLFVAIIGFAGYKVMNMNKTADTASISNVSRSTAAPATIKTKADLVQTRTSLDATSTELDSSLNHKSLDADVNSML